MKKKLKNLFCIIILLIITYEVLTSSNTIMKSVIFSFNIWKDNIFPSLFPFFILSELLINYGFVEILSEIMKPIMNKIFKVSGEASFIFIMSMLSGFPSNAKYTREMHQMGLIDEIEASKIMMFSHFSNPLFILGTVSVLFLNNKEAGLLIMICHYLGNIIIGLLFRNYYSIQNSNNKVSIKNAINTLNKRKSLPFGTLITKAIKNAIDTLLLILGVVTICLVFTTIIDNNINLNSFHQSILNGFVEMTQGLRYVSILNIPLRLKSIISTMILSFGGLSVHIQTISIISDTKIKYLPFLTARVIHAFISSFLVYIFFNVWINII